MCANYFLHEPLAGNVFVLNTVKETSTMTDQFAKLLKCVLVRAGAAYLSLI